VTKLYIVTKLQTVTRLYTVTKVQTVTTLYAVTKLQTVTKLYTVTELQTVTKLYTVAKLQAVTKLYTVTKVQTVTKLCTVTKLQTVTKLCTVTKLQTVTKLYTVTKLQIVTKRNVTQEAGHAVTSVSVVKSPLTSKIDDEDWPTARSCRFIPRKKQLTHFLIRCLYPPLGHSIKTVRNAQDEYDASREQEIDVIFIDKHQAKRSLNIGVESVEKLI
jgi:uncharacterized protein YerC